MADDNERLRLQVEELQRRLKAEAGVSGTLRDDLLRLLDDVDRHIGRSAPANPSVPAKGTAASSSDTLSERLLEAGQRFESTHPVLGTTIGNLADALSRIGI
jgi:hypothetical protein